MSIELPLLLFKVLMRCLFADEQAIADTDKTCWANGRYSHMSNETEASIGVLRSNVLVVLRLHKTHNSNQAS